MPPWVIWGCGIKRLFKRIICTFKNQVHFPSYDRGQCDAQRRDYPGSVTAHATKLTPIPLSFLWLQAGQLRVCHFPSSPPHFTPLHLPRHLLRSTQRTENYYCWIKHGFNLLHLHLRGPGCLFFAHPSPRAGLECPVLERCQPPPSLSLLSELPREAA